jgi:hypothetical protein
MAAHRRSFRVLRSAFRILHAAVLATLVLSTTASAQAAPPLTWQTSTLKVYPSGSVVVCKGQSRVFTVYVKVTTYRLFGSIFGSWEWPAHQWIDATQTSSNAGTISPGSKLTATETDLPNPYAWFTFNAENVGTTEVTFSDRGTAATMTTPNRPLADPVTVTIEVKECSYVIRATSHWLIAKGFQPYTTATFEVEVTPDQNGEFNVPTPVHNQAQWTIGYTCPHSIAASTTKATVKGNVSKGGIYFEVTYEPVTGHTLVPCHIGPWQATGDNTAGGNIARAFTAAPLSVGMFADPYTTIVRYVSHNLDADGTWPGGSQLSVTTMPH